MNIKRAGASYLTAIAKSSAYTILDTDGFQSLYVSGNTVIKLPVASKKRLIRFKKTDSNATTVQIKISDTGADTIEGNETFILREIYDSAVLESDGTATWYSF